MNECKAGRPTCGRCSGEHETKDCNRDNPVKCHNCTAAKITENQHETSDRNCGAYINAQEKYKSTVNYYNKSN